MEPPKWFQFLQIHFYNLVNQVRVLVWGPKIEIQKPHVAWNHNTMFRGCFAGFCFHVRSTGLQVQREPLANNPASPCAGAGRRMPSSLPPTKLCQAKCRWACSLLLPKSRFSKCLMIKTRKRKKKKKSNPFPLPPNYKKYINKTPLSLLENKASFMKKGNQ